MQIIGTVLLVAAVVIIGVTLFMFSLNVFHQTAPKEENISKTSILKLDSASINNNKLKLTMINISDTPYQGKALLTIKKGGAIVYTKEIDLNVEDIQTIEIEDDNLTNLSGNLQVEISGNNLVSSPTYFIKSTNKKENKVKATLIYPFGLVVGKNMEFQWTVPQPADCNIYLDDSLLDKIHCDSKCNYWKEISLGDHNWYVDCGIPTEKVDFTVVEGISVSNCNDLQDINNNLDSNYYLLTDINCEGINFNPIGSLSNKFTGIFDGRFHKIENVKVNGSDYVGIFSVTENAIIKNVKLIDLNISGGDFVGFVGDAFYTTFENIEISGTFDGISRVGSLVGGGSGKISNVKVLDSNVTGIFDVGGLIGASFGTEVNSVYVKSKIEGDDKVGGVVGWTNTNNDKYEKIIINSEIICDTNCGSLGGYIQDDNINQVVSFSKLKGSRIGGLIGSLWYSDLNNSRFVGDINSYVVSSIAYYVKYSKIENSYAAGTAEGTYYTTIDYAYDSNIRHIFDATDTSKVTSSKSITYKCNDTNYIEVYIDKSKTGILNTNSSRCTTNLPNSVLIDNSNYFYDLSNPPMDVWDRNIWTSTETYPKLKFESLK